MTDAREEPDLVLLEAHSWTAAIAQAATDSSAPMSSTVTCNPAGKPLDDDDERLAVGLTGGQEAQHPSMVPVGHRSPGRVLS